MAVRHMTPPHLQIERTENPRGIRLAGEADVGTADRLDQALRDVMGDGASITVDVTDLTFIDSSGVRVLLTASARANGQPVITLKNASRMFMRVIEILGVADRFAFDRDDTDTESIGG